MNDLFEMPWNQIPVLCIDTETTGFSRNDRICEIAMHVVCGDKVLETFHSLVNPRCPIGQGAQAVHGISDDDVRDAPEFSDIKDKILGFLRRDIPWVAHQLSFDTRMLSYDIPRNEWPEGIPTLCTMDFAKKHHPRLKLHSGHKLLDVAGMLQINYDRDMAHNALNDAELLGRIVPELMGTRTLGQNYTKLSEAWLKPE